MYAGIDIGILNLAICIIDSEEYINFINKNTTNPGIKLWKNINLLDVKICNGILKSGTNCECIASWHNKNGYFCGKHKNNTCKKYTRETSKNISLQKLKQRAFLELDKIQLLKYVKTVSIEKQPRIATNKMKLFGDSIETYFIIRRIDNNTKIVIKNSSPKNKLKLYNGPYIDTSHITDSYKRNKYLAIKQVEYLLNNEIVGDKKDDLADAFLHCLLGFL